MTTNVNISVPAQQSSISSAQWFNLHVEGCGSLYNARHVTPQPGRRFQPFLAVRMALLQGPTNAPEPLFIDFKVTGDRAIKVIGAYLDQINNKEITTFASVKFSDLAIEPNPQAKDGKQPFFMKGRLINVKYLKIGGHEIDLSQFEAAYAEPVRQPAAPQQPQEAMQPQVPPQAAMQSQPQAHAGHMA